ncbi:hypothetical protein BC828DRAFT_391799 [Blastocladiella britannica]|nr:hypothetical protein BC828DRAFT_391799 [Blastocladiella britannica]
MIDHIAYHILAHAGSTVRSPQDAIQVLNVLPQHDSVLTAVLSRGFQEFNPSLAIKHGHAHLLPHYLAHILIANLNGTLESAAKLGDLPVFIKLWELAGPATISRALWLRSDYYGGPVVTLMRHVCVDILDWFAGAAASASLHIQWKNSSHWQRAANTGHTDVLMWAFEHTYLENPTPELVFMSTITGNVAFLKHWIASQPEKAKAIAILKREYSLFLFLQHASIATLDWWRAHVVSSFELPGRHVFDEVIGHLLCNCNDTAIIEWWWARFLELRRPLDTFGSRSVVMASGWYFTPEAAEWLWQHSHESGTHWDSSLSAFAFAPDWHDLMLHKTASLYRGLTVSQLQWWIEKSVLVGQKLVITSDLLKSCVRTGNIAALDCIFNAPSNMLQVDWGQELVNYALESVQLNVLLWWDAHRNELPDQDLDCSNQLWHAAEHDAADVLDWWHDRYPLTAKKDCQRVLTGAIRNNARAVQDWFRSHPDLVCSSVMIPAYICPAPFTLDFLTEFGTTLNMPRFTNMVAAAWQCHRSGVAIDSLLPLAPEQWDSVIDGCDFIATEWWLQAHLAAGLAIVFPHVDNMIRVKNAAKDDMERIWLDDVIDTRKILLLMQSESDPVPFTRPWSV